MAEFSQGVGLIIRGLVAMLFAVGLVGGLHVYLGFRLVSAPALGQPWTALGWVALGLLFVSIPLGFVASRRVKRTAGGCLARLLRFTLRVCPGRPLAVLVPWSQSPPL
jgi:hypothetical protein